jgi:hypothetical protein
MTGFPNGEKGGGDSINDYYIFIYLYCVNTSPGRGGGGRGGELPTYSSIHLSRRQLLSNHLPPPSLRGHLGIEGGGGDACILQGRNLSIPLKTVYYLVLA